jgi:hypothetical protein
MTLANILRQKLSDAPAVCERHEFSVADEASGWTLYVTADRRDAWTTVALEISLRRNTSSGDLAAWAEQIARKTSGLLETLRIVEVDGPSGVALLRSGPPTERDGKIHYYEVILKGTASALVRRFEGTHASGKRDQVPFVLTNEVLAKFVGDLAGQ